MAALAQADEDAEVGDRAVRDAGPAFGDDDARVCPRDGVPMRDATDLEGRFTAAFALTATATPLSPPVAAASFFSALASATA